MNGYFSHIVNRSRGLPSGRQLLRPPVSRNPFALRENTAHAHTEDGENGAHLTAESTFSRPEVPPLTPPVSPDPIKSSSFFPTENPQLPAKPTILPQQSAETVSQRPVLPEAFPHIQPPVSKETAIQPETTRQEGTKADRMQAGEERLQPREKAFSIRYSVEKTESIQQTVREQETKEQPRKRVNEQESHSRKEHPQLVPIGRLVEQKPEPVLKPRIMPRLQAPEVQSQPRTPKAQVQPKLVIGKLTVEVVQQQLPAVQTVAREPRETKPQTQTAQNGSTHRYKLKFGLGQL